MNSLLKGKFVANLSIFLMACTACYIAVCGGEGSDERFLNVCLAVSPMLGFLITGIWAGNYTQSKNQPPPPK